MFDFHDFEAPNQYQLNAMSEKDIYLCLDGVGMMLSDVSFLKQRIEQEVEEQERSEMEVCLLHIASRIGSMDVLQYLVEDRTVDVECNDDDVGRNTPLHSACSGGSLPAVKYLVEKRKANTTALNSEDWTPLHVASFSGHLDIVQYLIEERKLESQCQSGSCGDSPLLAACHSNEISIVRYLLPHSVVDEEALSLMWEEEACSWDLREELMANYLEHHHASLPAVLPINYRKHFPLHAALQCPLPSEEAFMNCLGHYGTKNRLITMDTKGRLPLHVALESASTLPHLTAKLMEKLIELEPRASTVKESSRGLYPFQIATEILSNKADDDDDDDWFKVMHDLLVNHDPTILFSNLALPTKQEEETSRKYRQDAIFDDLALKKGRKVAVPFRQRIVVCGKNLVHKLNPFGRRDLKVFHY